MTYPVTTLGGIDACCDACAARSSIGGIWDALEILSPITWATRVVAQSTPIDPLHVVAKSVAPEGWSDVAKPALVAGAVILLGGSALMLASIVRGGR